MSAEKLDQLLRPLMRTAQRLDLRPDAGAKEGGVLTKFGGLPFAAKGELWPVCPRCRQDLIFIYQFVVETTESLFVFFYCMECSPWGLADEARGMWVLRRYESPCMDQYGPISPAEPLLFNVVPCSVARHTVTVLPDWEGLDTASEEPALLCGKLNATAPWDVYAEAQHRLGCWDEYATILGGYPRWVQGEVIVPCPKCQSDLEFLGQIDSEEKANIMWGDCGLIYLFLCPDHPDEIHMELQCY
ncbi:MAG: DUF1963 domain-containing protein [Candidatus Omnitrophica bacterium]|nr:DUF1963 domain-containing protein [Candidatus Omnitrophota bacterium]